GTVFYASYGALHEVPVGPQGYTVDTGHVVGFTDGVQFGVRPFGGFKGLFFSGEGLVCNFTGSGSVLVQTRNAQRLAAFLHPFRRVQSNNWRRPRAAPANGAWRRPGWRRRPTTLGEGLSPERPSRPEPQTIAPPTNAAATIGRRFAGPAAPLSTGGAARMVRARGRIAAARALAADAEVSCGVVGAVLGAVAASALPGGSTAGAAGVPRAVLVGRTALAASVHSEPPAALADVPTLPA